MPKSKDCQGQSELATEQKQRGLSFAFNLNYHVARKHASWMPPYLHIDLNAGSGYNDAAGCVGSPITFLRVFNGIDNFKAIFVDNDQEQTQKLMSHPEIKDNHLCCVICGNNADLLNALPRAFEKHGWQMGSILSDPNGADVPIEEISSVCRVFPKMDVMFHWNSTITKRLKYGIKPSQITLEDVPNIVKKDHWLIREPVGPHQFVMLIGRNFRGKDWPAGGFRHLDSPEGKAIIDRCSKSLKELKVQGK